MSRGAADWVARTDVLLQSIAELSARIKLGFSKAYYYFDYVGASADTLLFSITGKGNFIAAASWIQDTAQIDDDYFYTVVDGEVLPDWPFTWHRTFAPIVVPGDISTLGLIDDVNFRYWLVFNKVITFETYFQVYFSEAHGRTPLLEGGAMIGTY